jgi:hypothetical protein
MPFSFSIGELIFIVGGLIAIPLIGYQLIAPWLDSMRNAEARGIEPLREGEHAPLNDAIRHNIAVLEALGFTSLGITKTKVGSTTGYTHHLMSTDGSIHAEVVTYFDGAAVSFTTMLQDESAVETSTPIGEKIRTPSFQADWTREGLQAAYDLHRRGMEPFMAARMSRPWPAASLADLAEQEKVYRARHFRRKLRPGLMRSVWLVAAMALAVLAAIAALIAMRFIDLLDPYRSLAIWVMIAALVIGVPSLIAMFYILARISYHSGK